MKKNILFALLSLMPLLSSAKISPEEIKLGSENPEGVVSYVGALTNKQSLAFTYAKQWVSKTFNNYWKVYLSELTTLSISCSKFISLDNSGF